MYLVDKKALIGPASGAADLAIRVVVVNFDVDSLLCMKAQR